MKKLLIHIILLTCIIAFSGKINGQNRDAFSYIEKYNQRMDSIRNYSAVFTIKTDIQQLSFKDVKGKIFFKWPVHYSISTDEYTILPKNKLTPIIRFISSTDYKAVERATERVNDHLCRVIDLFPNDSTSRFDHLIVWVDSEYSLVRRILIKDKDKSKLVYHYIYKNTGDLLPSKLVYTFETLTKNNKPITLNPLSFSNKMEEPKQIKGTITVDFNYTEIRREGEQY